VPSSCIAAARTSADATLGTFCIAPTVPGDSAFAPGETEAVAEGSTFEVLSIFDSPVSVEAARQPVEETP
jgi:hypothetical protein